MGNPLSILHLEDDRDDAELIRRRLEAAGLECRITRAQTRDDFRRQLAAARFDLIISDFTLPSIDGLSALALARESFPEVPFIFVSGTIGEDRAVESLLQGATDYVLKTGDMKRLVPAVRRALRETQERRERRRLEEEYRQAQKMEAVGRLAGGIAHDFNNLLTAIVGLTELSLLELKPGQIKRDLEEILATAARASQLTTRLLAFSRKQVVAPRIVDVGEVAKGLEMMLRRIIGEDVELACRAAPGLRPVLVDPGQIEQIVVNLAVNARDAMPRGGRLLIEVENADLGGAARGSLAPARAGEFVRLRVQDTGTGMSEEVRAHLFEPFFTTKPPGKGTGLGLATCHGIAVQSGGFIEAASEPGRGTTFDVYLPKSLGEAASVARPARAAEDPRGRETILVVEDDAAVRRLTVRQLRGLGYEVLEAGDGVAAAETARGDRTGRIKLVLTDVVMPRAGGRGLAASLVRDRPDVKILYTSGYADETISREGVLQPGMHFVAKPYTLGTLARKVREALDG